jgi:hypothetical protein
MQFWATQAAETAYVLFVSRDLSMALLDIPLPVIEHGTTGCVLRAMYVI